MYSDKIYGLATVGAGAAKVTTATGDAAMVYHVATQMKVTRIMALVTTLVANDTIAAVITVYRRPTLGSAVGQVAIGTLTIPDGSAVSKVIYKDLDGTVVYPGEEIAFNVSTAGTDSGVAAGAFVGSFEADYDPEYAANQSNMVASA